MAVGGAEGAPPLACPFARPFWALTFQLPPVITGLR